MIFQEPQYPGEIQNTETTPVSQLAEEEQGKMLKIFPQKTPGHRCINGQFSECFIVAIQGENDAIISLGCGFHSC